MGIVYDGAYADDVHHGAFHEGYAARLWADGTLGGTWGGEYGWTGHIGLVGACDCGWRCDRVRPPGEYGGPEYEAAERDFVTEHLDQLIEAAKQRSWPQWTQRVSSLADQIATLAQWGRLDDARDILDTLRDAVQRRATALAELELQQQADHEREPTATSFGPIGDQPQPLPGTMPVPPASAARRPHVR